MLQVCIEHTDSRKLLSVLIQPTQPDTSRAQDKSPSRQKLAGNRLAPNCFAFLQCNWSAAKLLVERSASPATLKKIYKPSARALS